MEHDTSRSKNKELIYFSLTISIETDNKIDLIYSYKEHDYFESEIKKFLSHAIYLMGITNKKKKADLKLESRVDKNESKHILFYEKSVDQPDLDIQFEEDFLNHAFKVTKDIVDTINIINKSHSVGITLTPQFDPNITELFKIEDDKVIYQKKQAIVLINDFLNLQPKLPEHIKIGSKGKDIALIKTAELAPPLKKKKLNTDKITIKGNIAAIQYFPYRKIKIREVDSYPQKIHSIEITKSCCNFQEFIKLKENALVNVCLELSSTTDQYNIIEFKGLEQNKQTIKDLFDELLE